LDLPPLAREDARLGPTTPVPIVDKPAAVETAATVVAEDPDDPYSAYYDPANVVTIRGAVTGIYRFPLSNDRTGILVRLHVDAGQPYVYLGPDSWLVEHDFDPGITSVIAAKGTMHLAADGRSILIAREAVMNNLTLPIRDMDGRPLYPVPVKVVKKVD
jgi:hypothetical protein